MSKFLTSAETALDLIRTSGTEVVVKRKVPGTVDPVTDTETGGSETSVTYHAVAFPPSQQARFKVGSLEGRDVMEIYFALHGKATRPEPGDIVRLGPTAADDYTIFHAQTYDPALDGPIMTVAYAER